MKKIATPLVITFTLVLLVVWPNTSSASQLSAVNLTKRLVACGSIANGASLPVVQTSRLFLFLPKDYFPNIKLKITSHGATAGWISNAGAYGYAQSARAKPGCWSYYLDFELSPGNRTSTGSVDIGSTSALKTLSNYLIHFTVTNFLPNATKVRTGNGSVLGQVLLSPVCPVEQNPPNPACAPKPYKTSLNLWSTWTGSAYKSVAANSLGVFNLSLAPGPYVIQVQKNANGSAYPRCSETSFSVVAKKNVKIIVNCDTGIR